jgi:hypothetical protein
VTTIAWDGSTLAGDSLATDDLTAIEVCKLVKTPEGAAGAAGDLSECAAVLAWMASGAEGDAPAIPNCSVLFTRGRDCFIAQSGWPGIRVKGPVAIGSGAQGALVAMRLGSDAEAAVRAVSGIDPATGGAVDVMRAKRRR